MADHLYALPEGYRLESYEFHHVLSLGRYGIKYVAANHQDGGQVAIKEYLPDGVAVRQQDGVEVLPKSSAEKANFEAGLGRFLDEAQVQSRINHPNLVRTHRTLRANGTAYVVMDYVLGTTLSSELAAKNTLPEQTLLRIALSILGALEKIHDIGFLHQDIRPGNIILRPDGSALLLEPGGGRRNLGAARQAFGVQPDRTELVPPAAGYAALEQYSHRGRLGPWTDIYALGAVLYHCACGQPPPDAPARAINDEYVDVRRAAQGEYGEGTLAAIEPALAMPATARPSSVAAWRPRFSATPGAGDAHRPLRQARRLAARGGAAPAGGSQSGAQGRAARWLLPVVATFAAVALITWLDVGVLPDDSVAKPIGQPPLAAVKTSGATLAVYTTPPGAEVKLDEAQLGKTPLELDNLAAGEYALALRHPLYETVDLPAVTLAAGELTRIERNLVRAKGALEVVTTPPGAWVERDGKRWPGVTPMTMEALPAGPLTLLVGAEGYKAREVPAQVPRDGTGTLRVDLESSVVYGTLRLSLRPADANVTLLDVATTYSPGVRLPVGEYRVRVNRAGYIAQTRTVTVNGEASAAFSLVVDPQPFTVAVTPEQAQVRFVGGDNPYRPGIPLPPGDYRVQAVLVGHETWDETIAHGNAATVREVVLPPGIAEFADTTAGGASGPTMVLVPAGSFRMGCVSGVGCRRDEQPIREVAFDAPFALSKFEVTFDEYDQFAQATGRAQAPLPRGWSRTGRPVVNVSWSDAGAYAEWLSGETGRRYRLPSEAEWEYAARAGAATAYSWGDELRRDAANCNGCGSQWDNDRTAPVGFFPPNPWGLHDMHGNVWEWTLDCRNDDLAGVPSDGSARSAGDCLRRMLRGGSWSNRPEGLRAARREWDEVALVAAEIGFRVAADAEVP